MNNGNQLYQGKTKGEIAELAFIVFGPDATREQVDNYFRREFNILKGCETSMYYVAKNNAKRKQKDTVETKLVDAIQVLENTVNHLPQVNSPAELVNRTRQLAQDMGGYDQLLELVEALK